MSVKIKEMKKLSLYVFLGLLLCNASFAETPKAWKIDDKYLTPKCFLYEKLSSENFGALYDRYAPHKATIENKKWEDWWNNIGLYFGKEIPLEDSFEDSFGNTLSLTRYLKDCTSSKPIIEDEEKFLSYEVSGIKPKDSCKILAPNVSAKCLDIKIIKLSQKYLRMARIMESHIYGIFELANKNKIILPLKMYLVFEKKTSEAKIEDTSSLFEWIKNQTEHTNANELYWDEEKRFLRLIKSNISSKSFPSFTGTKGTLYEKFELVLGGPPRGIKHYDNRRYVVTSACQGHACPMKGLVFFDTKDKFVIGLIREWDGEYYIFSKTHKTFDDMPKLFIESVKTWTKEVGSGPLIPSQVMFIGADDKIIDVTSKY